jgi:hypothetical protein
LKFQIVVAGIVVEEMVVDRPSASRNIVPTVLNIQSAEFEQSTVYILYEMKETKRKFGGGVVSTSDAVLVIRRS